MYKQVSIKVKEKKELHDYGVSYVIYNNFEGLYTITTVIDINYPVEEKYCSAKAQGERGSSSVLTETKRSGPIIRMFKKYWLFGLLTINKNIKIFGEFQLINNKAYLYDFIAIQNREIFIQNINNKCINYLSFADICHTDNKSYNNHKTILRNCLEPIITNDAVNIINSYLYNRISNLFESVHRYKLVLRVYTNKKIKFKLNKEIKCTWIDIGIFNKIMDNNFKLDDLPISSELRSIYKNFFGIIIQN